MEDNPIIGRGWHFPPELDERGFVRLVAGDEKVAQAIRIVLGTAPGERVMRPEFGCRVHELLFEPMDATTAGLVDAYVREALGRWEPRIEVIDVSVPIYSDDRDERNLVYQGHLPVTIQYRIVATHSSRSLVYPFYLIPQEPQAAAR